MAARHPKYLTIQAQCENAFSDEAMESVIRGLSADTSLIFSRPLTLREGDSKDWIGFIEKLQRASWAFSAGSVTDMAGFVGKLKSAPHLKPSPTVPSASDVTPREGKPGSDLRVTQETRLPSDATTNSVGGRATDKLSDTKSPCEAGPTKNGLEQAEPKPASKLEAVVRPEADLNAASGKALDSNATTRSGEIRADNPSDAKPKKDAKKVQPKGESDPMLSGNGGEELTIDSLPSLLYGKLSAQTVRALADWQPGSDLKVLQKHLVQDLNAVINGDSIYTPRRFVGVKMRPETTKLLEEDPQGGEMVRLNRLLLEDAYPQEIERKRQSEEPLFDALWQRFDKATRDQLQEGENSAQSRNKSASFILDEINRVISEEPIFSQEFSSRASLRPWIQVMMCRSPKRTALVRLNRFALETAIRLTRMGTLYSIKLSDSEKVGFIISSSPAVSTLSKKTRREKPPCTLLQVGQSTMP
jgi:hypothetical protein